jgi:RNA polymerase sigma-70 factor (ECF subfamily)
MLEGDQAKLVDALRSGDEQAFATLVRTWTPTMQRLASLYVRTQASVDDVVQETWLAVIRGLPSFRGEASLRTWAMSILSNIARKQGVKDSRSIPWSSLTADEQSPAEDPGRFQGQGGQWPGHWTSAGAPFPWSPERLLLSDEIRNTLIVALERLPERQRVVVALRDVDGFTSREVCDVLGVTAANQRVLLHRGRTQLRSALEHFVAEARDDD